MRLPSAGGAGGGAHCYRYAGARRFVEENMTLFLRGKNMTRTRHATHPLAAVPVVARVAVGAVAGALPTALGRGEVRTPDDDDC